ncbi:hypothetical protein PENTCL1PPCAC_187, partial [Pristionchus entomophagus]
LILSGFISMAVMISAQCSKTDHPNCASWVKNGFCTNPGYTIVYIQQYCPKSCTNSGCNNSPGTILGPSVGGLCPEGYRLVFVPGGSAAGDC